MSGDQGKIKPAALTRPPPFPWLQLIPALALGALFALSNASVRRLMDIYSPGDWGAFWVYLTAGGMCAQFGLLALWGALGFGNTWSRQASVIAAGVIWTASWCVGSGWETQLGEIREDELGVVLCLPLMLLAAQLPLWTFHIFGQWRVAYDHPGIASRPPQMSIAGILRAMTLVGLALALVKLGLRLASVDTEGWILVGIAAGSFALASLIILPPVCVLSLRLQSWVAGLILSLLYLVCLAAIAHSVAFSIMPRGGPFATYLAFPATFSGFAGGLLVPLLLLRLANYRLRWGKEIAAPV